MRQEQRRTLLRGALIRGHVGVAMYLAQFECGLAHFVAQPSFLQLAVRLDHKQLVVCLLQRGALGPDVSKLDMSGMGLESIPVKNRAQWHSFSRLHSLDISNNELDSVPVQLAHLDSLSHVALSGNPLRLLPPSLAPFQWTTVKTYLLALIREMTSVCTRKVAVLGEEGVGKTTIIRVQSIASIVLLSPSHSHLSVCARNITLPM